MRRSFFFFFLFGFFLSLSCGKEQVVETEEPIKVAFSIDLPGIESFDEPLSRAGNPDYERYDYGIRITQYNTNTSKYEDYAVGAFDDISKATIDLYKSKKYNIEILVANHFYNTGNSITNNKFGGGSTGYIDLDNTFSFSSPVDIKSWMRNNIWGECYYGALNDYVPNDSGVCQVSLNNEATGIKVTVYGKTSGYVSLVLTSSIFNNGYEIKLDEETTSSSYLSFCSWINGSDERIEPCKWQYVDENGIVTILKEDSYTFKKGYRKVFEIRFNEQSLTPVSTGFAPSFEISNLSEESVISIEDIQL